MNLRSALESVSSESGVALADVTGSCIGTSGGSTVAEVVGWLREQMGMQVGGKLSIVGDEVITLDAAFPGGAGVVVIAGTGSNVIGRSRSGWTTGAGGWGPALADEGSGNLLGLQALRGVFAAINSGDDPPFLYQLLDHLGLRTRDELVAVANAANFSFAQLMPVVVRAARHGDRLAQATLEHGGEELAGLVLQVIGRLATAEPGIEDGLKIAGTGSILKHVGEVSGAMLRVVLRTYPQIEYVPEAVDPLLGALWHARRLGLTAGQLSAS